MFFKAIYPLLRIKQLCASANPDDMHAATFRAWNQHWQRDDPQSSDGLWDDLQSLLDVIPQRPQLPPTEFDFDVWQHHCKKLKIKAGRGGCGFSVKEMCRFPKPIVEMLFMLYQCCENGGPWPKLWIMAKVTLLSKTESPTSPYDVRPITVFSVLYRQWSRYRSREILRYFGSFMPKEVALATNCIPADTAAALLGLKVEQSINRGQSLCGVGVDLVRCFNTLPRKPLFDAMIRMGVPSRYVRAWTMILRDMTRTLAIGRSCSEPSISYTGVPEGCGMSVAAMAVISWWAVQTLHTHHPRTSQICYADNWHIIAACVQVLIDAIRTLEWFVRYLRMEIAPLKSYLWATLPKDRKLLKQVSINGIMVPVALNLCDLGCDIQCSKKKKVSKFKKRVEKAKRICRRIEHHQAPKRFKIKMARTSGLAAFACGTQLLGIAATQWKTIRAALARSMSLGTAGASPWLATTVCTGDPQLSHAFAICTFWRRFCFTFPEYQDIFLNEIHRIGISKIGPAASFRKTLNCLGWTLQPPHTLIHQVTGVKVDWLWGSKKWLHYVFEMHWGFKIHEKTQHRKGWTSTHLDLHLLHHVLNRFDDREQWNLRTFMSGKHYTFDAVHKFNHKVSANCPLCGCLDSKWHRIFQCKALDPIRKKHIQVIKFAKRQPGCFQWFGFPCYQDPSWQCIGQLPAMPASVQKPRPSDKLMYCFIDGSAFRQDIREFTLSGFSVVTADYLVNNHSCLVSGITPGWEHNSYRGEAYALCALLERVWKAEVFCDCQSVIDNYHCIESACLDGLPCPPVEHFDIWFKIYQLLQCRPPRSVSINKIRAHVDLQHVHDPFERWCHEGNDFADKTAKRAVQKHPAFQKLSRGYRTKKTMESFVQGFYSCICDLTKETFRLTRLKDDADQSKHEVADIMPDFSKWVGGHTGRRGVLVDPDSLEVDCIFGKTFYSRVHSWFSRLVWPTPDKWAPEQQGMSLLELYIDFVLTTQSEAPVNNAPARKLPVYFLLDEFPLLRGDGIALGRSSTTWHAFWQWVLKNGLVQPAIQFSDKRPIPHVGYSLRAPCFNLRAVPVSGCKCYELLWSYFHPSGGRRRNLSVPFTW